jgi:hypothetical protein
MLRTNVCFFVLCVLSLGMTACQEGIHFDGFDGSFFDDAGVDAGAGRDAATANPDEDEDGGGGGSGNSGKDDDAGSDAGGSSSSDAGTPAESRVPAQLAKALCDALADCYDSAAFRDDVLGGRDCLALNENTLADSELRYLSDSVKAGLVDFDADKIGACTSDIRELGCDARASRLPASCKAALAGTVLIAGECTINLDCQGDAFCDKGALETCPGVCSPLQAQGFPCNHDDDNQCKDGLVCSSGKCEALRSVGQSCGGADQTGCKPGLECADLGLGDGDQCVDIAAIYTVGVGAECDATDALCEPGLVCESVSGTQGICAKPVGRDASCKRAQPNQCPPGQYCDAAAVGESGRCVDAPGDGEACRTRAPLCDDGHACVSGTCHEVHAVGGTCANDRECYSGFCAGNICEAPMQCDAP